ncbi:hypothetical protein SJAG_02988 [Schizosaccharomyces japonicus yFS275]|uniref:D-lactate dehydratase n=1 Tax=Schizosaccharomyces japonicus (strain yFS275 / FY16936) TaxID=402676 RepID=B6K309_SCHJY|nr:hypothetical protein SJAG_02988 [Schizosaccharomyces japonicus yFS275]EEB07866.1 hypothetical protein SJAG_02988 [Schizosaccharomyces japonicus yFS275]
MHGKKVLLVASSVYVPFYPDGKKTGVHFSELLEPYKVFRENGFAVDFTSPNGSCQFDESSVDESSLPENEKKILHDKQDEFWKDLKRMIPAANVDPADYCLMFVAGGHAAMFDLPTAVDLHAVAAQIYKNGGVIAAVCHGPVMLPFVQDLKSKGEVSIVKGKHVTAFSKQGEQAMGVMNQMKQHHFRTLNEVFNSAGANFIDPPDPMGEFVQSDCRVVTGVNPASAIATAKTAVQALS